MGPWAGRAWALDPIDIKPDQDRLVLNALGQLYEGRGDWLQVETAPGPTGVTGRMAVQATTPGDQPELDRLRSPKPFQ